MGPLPTGPTGIIGCTGIVCSSSSGGGAGDEGPSAAACSGVEGKRRFTRTAGVAEALLLLQEPPFTLAPDEGEGGETFPGSGGLSC